MAKKQTVKKRITNRKQLASELARRCKRSGQMDDITVAQAAHVLKVLQGIVDDEMIPAQIVVKMVLGEGLIGRFRLAGV